MKISEVLNRMHLTQIPTKKSFATPVSYNPKDVTRDEFCAYIKYLSENKINRTFIEPTHFTTAEERAERINYQKRIESLAKSGKNITFFQ